MTPIPQKVNGVSMLNKTREEAITMIGVAAADEGGTSMMVQHGLPEYEDFMRVDMAADCFYIRFYFYAWFYFFRVVNSF